MPRGADPEWPLLKGLASGVFILPRLLVGGEVGPRPSLSTGRPIQSWKTASDHYVITRSRVSMAVPRGPINVGDLEDEDRVRFIRLIGRTYELSVKRHTGPLGQRLLVILPLRQLPPAVTILAEGRLLPP